MQSDRTPEYADRSGFWMERASALLGDGTVRLLRELTGLPPGSMVGLVPIGQTSASGGHVAAALVLHRICFSSAVARPPVRIVVTPDSPAGRIGYLSFRVSTRELEDLTKAWRIRAHARGNRTGDLLPAERGLRARRKRKGASGVRPEQETLHLFIPAFRAVLGSQELTTISSRAHLPQESEHDPAVVFTDRPALRCRSAGCVANDPDWILIDLQARCSPFDFADVLELRRRLPDARLLCLLPDLSHHWFNRLRGRGIPVVWLAAEASGPESPPDVSWRAGSFHGTREDVHRLLELLRGARRDAARVNRKEAWAAFGLLRAAVLTVTGLPIRRQYYDEAAIRLLGCPTVQELLELLAAAELGLASYAPALAAQLEEGNSILRHISGDDAHDTRTEEFLVGEVESAIGGDSSLLIAVRNRILRSAVEDFLVEALDTSLGDLLALGVQVETKRDLQGRLAGARPVGQVIWVGHSRAADLDTAIRWPTERLVMSLSYVDRAMLKSELGGWLDRARFALMGLEQFIPSPPKLPNLIRRLNSLREELELEDRLPAPADINALVEDLEVPDSLAASSLVSRTGTSRVSTRHAFMVSFEEAGRVAFFPDNTLLTVVRPPKRRGVELTVRELRQGDRVVFVHRGVRSTLYDVVADQMSKSPPLAVPAQLLRLWYRALAGAFERSDLTYEELLEKLQERGSSITTSQTMRLWIRGGVIGPRDPNDLDRIAAVLSIGQRDPRILNEVRRSVPILRKVHARFSRMVFRVCLAVGPEGVLSDSDRSLLEEYGFDLGDLRGAISTLTVKTVGDAPVMVNPSDIGKELMQSHAA